MKVGFLNEKNQSAFNPQMALTLRTSLDKAVECSAYEEAEALCNELLSMNTFNFGTLIQRA